MPADPPQLVRLAALLESAHIRYVLVGGLAVMLHGGDRVTQDVDLAIAYDPENRKRLGSALQQIHPRLERSAPGATWDETLIVPPWTMIWTDFGKIDLLVRLPGIDSFAGLYARSETLSYGETHVRLACIEDLISMKSFANRPRDRFDIETLLAIQKLQADAEPR